jgi:hypothetical protein
MNRRFVASAIASTVLLVIPLVSHAETVCGLVPSDAGYVEMKWPGTDWQVSGLVTGSIYIGPRWSFPVGPWHTYQFKRDGLPNNTTVLVRLRWHRDGDDPKKDRIGKIKAVATWDVSQGGDARYGVVRITNLSW